MSDASFSSGLQTTSKAIVTRPCYITCVQLLADGTNAGTLTVYDNASAASGNVVSAVKTKAGDQQIPEPCVPDEGVYCANGLYASVSGTGASYIVYYRLA